MVTTSFRLIALLAIPAGVGLSVLAGPILLLLYPAQRERMPRPSSRRIMVPWLSGTSVPQRMGPRCLR